MLIIYLFWSTKNKRFDFSQKYKNELLILIVYAPVVFDFGEATIEKISL